ncbi:MAG: DUF4397 domain-containing protein [Bacteroidia bacterium]|nr:DUF4397 domain-containing protein [Bacteroidia bacterium]
MKNWYVMLGGLLLTVWMTACLKNDTPEPQALAGVSIYHSAPDTPDLNVIIDLEVINTQAFRYKNYSDYLPISAGDHNFRFNDFSNGTNYVSSDLTVEVNKAYSLYVINTLSKVELLLVSDASEFPSSGNAKIRCLQLSPDAPQVEIKWVGEPSPLFSGLNFKTVVDFKEVVVNTYSMEVKVVGGTGQTFIVPNVEIKEGMLFTILIEGFDNPASGTSNPLTARVISN